MQLVDISGNGLPDLVEFGQTARFSGATVGDGSFAAPQQIQGVPAGLRLADPGVQHVDADGDSHADLMVSRSDISGYFPLGSAGPRGRAAFDAFAAARSRSRISPSGWST